MCKQIWQILVVNTASEHCIAYFKGLYPKVLLRYSLMLNIYKIKTKSRDLIKKVLVGTAACEEYKKMLTQNYYGRQLK